MVFAFILLSGSFLPGPQADQGIKVEDKGDYLYVETDQLQARIIKKGYVSGTAAGGLLDKKTDAKDVGFGLHIMDFLMAPGWRDDGYLRNLKIHGDLPKHFGHPTNRI